MKYLNKLIILIEIHLVQGLQEELLNIVIEVIVPLIKIMSEMITLKMVRMRKMEHFKRLKLVRDNLQAKVLLNIFNKLRKKAKNYMMHLLKL